MSEYVPTTDQVRDRYADDRVGVGEWTRFDESVKRAVEEAYAEFDAWLANHDAEVAAKAWALCDATITEHLVGNTAITAAIASGWPENPYRKEVPND